MNKNIIPSAPKLSNDKMRIVATKGIDAAKLTRAEMLYLAGPEGAQALCDVLDELNAPEKKPEPVIIIIFFFFTGIARSGPDANTKISENERCRIGSFTVRQPWVTGSSAFHHRGEADEGAGPQAAEMHFTTGKYTIHLEIVPKPNGSADVHAILTGGRSAAWEIALLRNNRTVESRSARETEDLILHDIPPGDYSLRIRRAERTLADTPLSIRLEPR